MAVWTGSLDRAVSLLRKYLPSALLVGSLLLLWESSVWLWQIEAYLLPAPSRVWSAAQQAAPLLSTHVQQTLRETLVGFALALICGLSLAMLIDLSPLLRRAIYPLLVVTQTIPIMTIAPLLAIWLGYTIWPKVIVVALVCFFPIVVATVDGLRSADPEVLALLQVIGASRWQVFTKVRVPAALPGVFSGVRIAIAYSVIGAIIGEWVGASKGLGVFMLRASNSFRTDWVFVAIAVTSLLSIVLFLVVAIVERMAIPWYYDGRRVERWEGLTR